MENSVEPVVSKSLPSEKVPTLEELLYKNNELLVSIASGQQILSEQVKSLLDNEKRKKMWALVKYGAIILLGVILPFFIMQQVWNGIMGSIGGSSQNSSLENILNVTTGAGTLKELENALQ